jgi:hypothetical protein
MSNFVINQDPPKVALTLTKNENVLFAKAIQSTLSSSSFNSSHVPCTFENPEIIDEDYVVQKNAYIPDEHPKESRDTILRLFRKNYPNASYGRESFDGDCFFTAISDQLQLLDMDYTAQKLRELVTNKVSIEIFGCKFCDIGKNMGIPATSSVYTTTICFYAELTNASSYTEISSACMNSLYRLSRHGSYVRTEIVGRAISDIFNCELIVHQLFGNPIGLEPRRYVPTLLCKDETLIPTPLHIAYFCEHFASLRTNLLKPGKSLLKHPFEIQSPTLCAYELYQTDTKYQYLHLYLSNRKVGHENELYDLGALKRPNIDLLITSCYVIQLNMVFNELDCLNIFLKWNNWIICILEQTKGPYTCHLRFIRSSQVDPLLSFPTGNLPITAILAIPTDSLVIARCISTNISLQLFCTQLN